MEKNSYRRLKSSNTLLIPIMFLMGFVPLIVHMFVYETGMQDFIWFPATAEKQAEFFFGWKMVAIIVVGVILTLVLLYRRFIKQEEFLFENSLYLLIVYAIFIIMSGLFSSYKQWVSGGTFELFESIWVLFAYLIACYYVYQYVKEEKQVYTLLAVVGIGALILTLIGVFQTVGLDFFKTSFGKHLIVNPSRWADLNAIQFQMAEGTAYTTLYNPNFLSFYYGMLIPILIGLLIGVKKIWQKAGLVVGLILSVISMKGSRSDSGWMALFFGIGIVVLILSSRKKKLFIAMITLAVAGAIGLIAILNVTTFGKNISASLTGTFHLNDKYSIKSIDTLDHEVVFDINGNKLHLSHTYNEATGDVVINCFDDDNTALTTTLTDAENHIYELNDDRFRGNIISQDGDSGALRTVFQEGQGSTITLAPSEYGDGFNVTLDNATWKFYRGDDGTYFFINPAGKLTKYEKSKAVELFNDDLMNYRGRIWNITIPAIAKHVVIGSGANTYIFEVAQNDYLFKALVGALGSFDVKAHNWYLQQCVETGVLGTLFLIAFLIMYLVRCSKIYRRADLKESLTWVGIGIFTAVLVYMIVALANDSNVCTAPVFWGLLGLGMAVNRIVNEHQQLLPVTPKE